MSQSAKHALGLIALFVILLAFYLLTYTNRAITDTDLNSLQTRALIRHGDIDLARYSDNPGREAQLVERDGRIYAIYGLGISVVSAPIYAVLLPFGVSESVLQAAVGATFGAASAVIICLVLLRLVAWPIAMVGTLSFAFGTTMWPVASMAFFQQGPVVFLICLGLAGLLVRTAGGLTIAGVAFGSAAFVRPTVGISLIVIGLFLLTEGKRALLRFAIGAAAPLAALLISNRWIWGTWIEGGYAHTGIGFNADAPTSFVGLTIGWWRGVFAYSPFLVLGVIGWVIALKNFDESLERRLSAHGMAALATLLFYSKWDDWGGGINQFGYRLQLEIVPYLVVLAAYAAARVPKLRLPGLTLAVISVLTMTWGAVDSPDHWDGVLFASRLSQTSIGRAWSHLGVDPLPGVTLLLGVAFAAAMILLVSRSLAPNEAPESPASVGAA